MKTAIFISVRNKSTRLPGKALLQIKGRTMIEHLIDRLKLAKLPNLIVLCTSTNSQDDSLAEIAEKNSIEYFRGSEDDVLYRYLKAGDKFNVDFAVIALGDATFVDPEYIDKTIEFFKETDADFIKIPELPIGTFTYGLKIEAVRKVCEMKDATDTEVWGGYFAHQGFDVRDLKVEEKELRHPEIRLVVDYPDDFELIKEIYKRLYQEDKIISLKEVTELLEAHPELLEINRKAQEMYEENIKKAPAAKFKENK